MKGIRVETNFRNDIKLQEVGTFEFEKDTLTEWQTVNIYPNLKYQEWVGFGGAFTEAAGYTLSKMSPDKQDEMINAYFGENGINYNFCRNHINSCDFALGNYAYVEDENDKDFETFNIDRDRQYIIPMIKKAQAVSKNKIRFLASPWSPPAFMKDTKMMNRGGKLLPEYYTPWAKYIARYIKEYKKEGIDIFVLTVQNEPNATQTWDSCVYNGTEEMIFIRDHLAPVLKEEGLEDVKIMFWDHNKERVFERACETMADKDAKDAIWGVAFHWYTGDHFEALRMTKDMFPDKHLIFTEGCVEAYVMKDPIQNAERYAHDIIGDLNNGCDGFIDWNMFLDEIGGPNHVKNYCAAPIQADTTKNEIIYNPTYYYIGQFSKYIPAGSVKIGSSSFSDKVEVTAFLTPENKRVVVALNRSEDEWYFNLRDSGEVVQHTIAPRSIITLVYGD
ncbi:MAG: glycoside hydrolase family 30 protein [Clostridia bacterium]|nr:glycoside hydrolase family 30 protein [Clostridia bacterium]